jgi:hypothetical protein
LQCDQWIAARPAEDLEDWRTAEAEAHEIYDDSFGERAPHDARELAVGLKPRLVLVGPRCARSCCAWISIWTI